MIQKKILLTGNSTCANRGDCAILRGITDSMEKMYPEYRFEISSRFPKGSSYLMGRDIVDDKLYTLHKPLKGIRRAIQMVIQKLMYSYLYYLIKYPSFRKVFGIPKRYNKAIRYLNEFDAIIHVGGSFFIDLYGLKQFDTMIISVLISKPVYLVGHSLGPFQIKKVSQFASILLPKIKHIYLREDESLKYLDTLSAKFSNVSIGSDTAWVLPGSLPTEIFCKEVKEENKKFIAITIRNLKPFDKRLEISQEEFESMFAQQINILIEKGYHIIAVSMCTGFDSYPIDDRIVALSIKTKLARPECMTVLMYEYNDLELGFILSKCDLLIGTRLHSVILSLRYNTPAIALYYEHKSLGILRKVALEQYSFTIKELGSERMNDTIEEILSDLDFTKKQIAEKINREQQVCKNMLQNLFKENALIKNG
jgi:colanic acid/amylovoran biosynthesis protein